MPRTITQTVKPNTCMLDHTCMLDGQTNKKRQLNIETATAGIKQNNLQKNNFRSRSKWLE